MTDRTPGGGTKSAGVNRAETAEVSRADAPVETGTRPAEATRPATGWDAYVAAHPLATYLQLSGWARVKAANGWSAGLVSTGLPDGRRIGAQVLLRRPRGVPWTFAYAPRGPLADEMTEEALARWAEEARRRIRDGGLGRVAHLRIDPEIESGRSTGAGMPVVDALRRLGWRPAPEVQPSVTRIVDLVPDEAALWSDLRHKWRQYVNRARTLGVTIDDVDADADETAFPTFHRIMTETRQRTGTPIRTLAAYRDVWTAFRPGGGARLLFARSADGEPVACLLLVRAGRRVVEPYGGMTAAGADTRANYLLKWEAIRSSRAEGDISYDMWGLVHAGIRQFKEGFGGREVRLIGAWDLPIDRVGAAAYRLAGQVRGGRGLGRRGLGGRALGRPEGTSAGPASGEPA